MFKRITLVVAAVLTLVALSVLPPLAAAASARTVLPRVILQVAPKVVPAGGWVVLTGTVSHPIRGAKTVTVQGKFGEAWRPLVKARLTSTGKYSANLQSSAPGTRQLRAAYLAGKVKAVSPSVSFTVVPAPTITYFTPTSGPVGTIVTVSGTG
ncbi:MAG: hypothetical protein WCP21_01635, partial [Armatimonadota bacterium]